MTTKEGPFRRIPKYNSFDETTQQFRDGKWEDISPSELLAEVDRLKSEIETIATKAWDESSRLGHDLLEKTTKDRDHLAVEVERLNAENAKLRAIIVDMQNLLTTDLCHFYYDALNICNKAPDGEK